MILFPCGSQHKLRDWMGYTRKHRPSARGPPIDVTSKFAPILMNWDAPEILQDATENDKHWQMVNVWRPLKLIQKCPVTVAHTESGLGVLQPEVGQGTEGPWLQRLQDAKRQPEWCFLDEQTPKEVLLFLQHDSKGAQVIRHTYFQLPREVPKEIRESIEVWLFVI